MAQSLAERQQSLRARRLMLGLVRLELFAHPDDHARLKKYAQQLQAARACTSASTAPRGGTSSS